MQQILYESHTAPSSVDPARQFEPEGKKIELPDCSKR